MARRMAWPRYPPLTMFKIVLLQPWHTLSHPGAEEAVSFVEHAKRVPASFANRPVSRRVYPERIVVVAEGQVVCEHRRVFARSHERKSTTTVYDWRRYLAVIQRKPGALRNGAPFVELPPAFRALQHA